MVLTVQCFLLFFFFSPSLTLLVKVRFLLDPKTEAILEGKKRTKKKHNLHNPPPPIAAQVNSAYVMDATQVRWEGKREREKGERRVQSKRQEAQDFMIHLCAWNSYLMHFHCILYITAFAFSSPRVSLSTWDQLRVERQNEASKKVEMREKWRVEWKKKKKSTHKVLQKF